MIYFLISLLVFISVLLVCAYYAYRIAFFSPMKGRDELTPVRGSNYDPYREEMRRIYRQLKDRPYEEIHITSHDGLILAGRYYHVKDGAPLAIGFHGYRSTSARDFAGGSELLLQMEHNLLLVDQRAHGKSSGRTISFGILERQDLLKWVDYALARFGHDVKILLYGISMGGATVLMASELPRPKTVRGIIADCPYSSPMDVILYVGRDKPVPTWLIRPFAIWGAKIFGGFDLTEADARSAVAHSRVPILILHGENDTFVPAEMSRIEDSNPEMVSRYTFPHADHGISCLVDGPRYRKIVTDFVSRVL